MANPSTTCTFNIPHIKPYPANLENLVSS